MKTHRNTSRPGRASNERCRLDFDRLETRLAMSSTATVLLVAPAPDSTSAQAPAVLKVKFSEAILPPSVSSDFELERIAPNGSTTSVATVGNGLTESLDFDPTVIDIKTAVPLGAGEYRVVLLASSALKGSDFSSLAGGTDQMVGSFAISSQGVGLGNAQDMGSLPSTTVSATGGLNLAENPSAVGLYKFELPTGHFWQLGVEVNAESIGSPLLSRLSVFDASGKLVSSTIAGLPNTPDDPYLFLGLNPGTYYIGISGIGNVPGQPGGYNIATATAGSTQTGLISGAYRLDMIADPADPLTDVESISVDYADPTSDMPTGLTMQFNGPLNEVPMANHQNQLITLIDASGHPWQADAVNYDRGTAKLSFLFDEPLPAGTYTVALGGQGNLVDLTGRAPVANGLPAATLGSFRVSPYVASADPNNLGPILPGVAIARVGGDSLAAAGQTASTGMFLTQSGFYELTTSYSGGSPIIDVIAGGKTFLLDPGASGVEEHASLYLPAGNVEINVGGGQGGTDLNWSVRFQPIGHDHLLDNGVGQLSALSLRLVTPDTSANGSLTTAPAASNAPATSGEASANAAAAPQPGLYVTANSGLVGHPAELNDSIAPVGPVTPTGLTALASSDPGLPRGLAIGYGQRIVSPRRDTSGALHETLEVAEEDSPTTADVATTGLPDRNANAAVASIESQGPSLFERTAMAIAGMLPRARNAEPASNNPDALDELALASLGLDRGSTDPAAEEHGEAADLSGSVGVAVIAVAASHYQRRIGRWLASRRAPRIASTSGYVPGGPRHGAG
jgi:methionine-rich copper-binding protein CopC